MGSGFQSTGDGQRGSALVLVILMALIATALGGTMVIMSNSDHRISGTERDAERALAASRAGLSYGFHLFQEELITASAAGTAFNSFAASVGTPLDGAEFSGRLIDISELMGQGQLYQIVSTGTFNRSSRTTELTFQIVPDSFKFGYLAFNEATLHNHSGMAGPTFRIESTIFSNGSVSVPANLTIDGSIVTAGTASIDGGSTINGDIFANEVDNKGAINGDVKLITAVAGLPSDALAWDRVDAYGDKYEWFDGTSTPGSYGGGGTMTGALSSYTIQNGDIFQSNIFSRNGNLVLDPDVNVSEYISPPLLDYQAMKAEAEENDPTYFTTTEAAVTYMISKKVSETVGGRDVVTVRIGTPDRPEFMYIDGDLKLTVQRGIGDDAGGGKIDADALYIEGGFYITGGFDYEGQDFIAPDPPSPPYPVPPDYYMLSINALPYCYPALLAYEQPGSGTIDTWTLDDTPMMGSGGSINMSGGGDEGPSFFNGLVFAQGDIHLHHTSDPRELIRFNGSQVAYKIHNCDFFWFSYDPDVRCTRFLVSSQGDPQVVAFREVR